MAGSFPQASTVIHAQFTACPQISVGNSGNISIAFAAGNRALSKLAGILLLTGDFE
jgi:hypothetical protein